jgi:glycerol uptake facilitator-like aquaporin
MNLLQRTLAEYLGSAGLLMVVVGSGIMGQSLSQGNDAIALLANSLATGAGLYALIQTFGPISGAHFNPAVSLVEFLVKKLSARGWMAYTLAQIAGALSGVFLAHLIFGLNVLQNSHHARSGLALGISEVIATFGLLLVIGLSGRRNVEATPVAVSCYIVAAYWFTSSTSFANPAVTIARGFTDTFSGIAPGSILAFIAAQFVGAILAYFATRIFQEKRKT